MDSILTREQFIGEWSASHPQPEFKEPAGFAFPDFKPHSFMRSWRFWVFVFPIIAAILVSLLRTQGSFYDIAKKGNYLLGIETAIWESVNGSLIFDLALIALMAERVQRVRKSQHKGWIDAGLALTLVITGITNFQQGLANAHAIVGDDWIARVFYTAFVGLLSVGVPVILAILGNVLGELVHAFDQDNQKEKQEHITARVSARSEHESRHNSQLALYETAKVKWEQRANAAWANHVRRQTRTNEQADAPFVRRTNERTRTNTSVQVRTRERTSREQIPSNLIVDFFRRSPGGTLRNAAYFVAERGYACDHNKALRLARRAQVEGLLQFDENGGKFYPASNGSGGAESVYSETAPPL